ncbi:two component, sigma54 specific, transcriptional regulator, Fis family protein [Plesiocystis pacifica SIR-1]|uniref:Two component, sigma54 specific, transcriptional regulator, Fis family protein n=1 Tax=Plesiocystis pacifica SIR-1 TaxID=391625 RepID=A6FXH4_9BACT|nr:two component, sigma54 specific, transcriptional regulator, Fis family protein [Plesiocystis pacifica SIR-1]
MLCTASGRSGAEDLAQELRRDLSRADNPRPRVEVVEVEVDDPSDYAQIFASLGPALDGLERRGACDVLLSAGTPQMQTLWVILVQAGLLSARMLQVIPAAFVPVPHPEPVRVVELDIEGFPEIRALREELTRLRAEVVRGRGGGLVGESEAMVRLARRLRRVAQAPVPVLIQGETGTGKELVAHAVHAASERSRGPFVAENCGSFSEGVLASELFGHERGAFTGAVGRRRGLFERAHGGTLFLDEIAETSPRTQVMLLRVLQEGRLRRVGGEGEVRVDVRVLAATHRDLRAMVAEGSFREDLYYRLRGATLELPPLRERGGDLELLVAHFLDELGSGKGRRKRARRWPTAAAWEALRRYGWPGNVRELRAEVVRWSVFGEGPVELGELSPEICGGPLGAHSSGRGLGRGRGEGAPVVRRGATEAIEDALRPLAEQVGALEARVLADAMERLGGNLSATSRALGIDRNTLKRKLTRHGLR